MSEMKELLQQLLFKPVSIVQDHGYRVDGILASVGEELILINSVIEESTGLQGECNQWITISSINTVRNNGEHIKNIEKFILNKTSKSLENIEIK